MNWNELKSMAPLLGGRVGVLLWDAFGQQFIFHQSGDRCCVDFRALRVEVTAIAEVLVGIPQVLIPQHAELREALQGLDHCPVHSWRTTLPHPPVIRDHEKLDAISIGDALEGGKGLRRRCRIAVFHVTAIAHQSEVVRQAISWKTTLSIDEIVAPVTLQKA